MYQLSNSIRVWKQHRAFYPCSITVYWFTLNNCTAPLCPLLVNSRVPFPPPLCQKKSHCWTLPTASPQLFPESQQRDRKTEEKKKNRRGEWDEMCFKDGRAPTHCRVTFSCLLKSWSLERAGGTRQAAEEIKDGCKAPHHQTFFSWFNHIPR